MRITRLFFIAALFSGLIASSTVAFAEEAPQTVEERLDSLDQKVKVLERKREVDIEATTEKAKDNVSVTAKDGFSIKSADNSFVLKIRGFIQSDGRFFTDNSGLGTNALLVRRIRPTIEGTVAKYYDFRIVPDFGGGAFSLQDAYLDIHPWSEAFKIRTGKFIPPIGLEQLQGSPEVIFAERSLVSQIAPSRDVGFQIFGDLWDGSLSYAVGTFDGAVDGGSSDTDTNNAKDIDARIFALPFKNSDIEALAGLGLGVSGSWGDQNSNAAAPLPTYKSTGQLTFYSYKAGVVANGQRTRTSPQLYWYWGPFGLLSEYISSVQNFKSGATAADLTNTAWQASVSYVLTGEDASFKGVKPKHPFDPATGDWGALELAARYHELNIDPLAFPTFATSAVGVQQKASAWGAGINWYLSKNLRYILDYETTTFTAAAGGVARPAESVIETRFQIVF